MTTATATKTKTAYEAYLLTPEWARIRNECMSRAYKRLGKAGELADLIALCEECHTRHHAPTLGDG